MNYYSHHIGDYRRDTGHLSLLEHGAYRQLLDMYYLSEQSIPEQTEVVFRRLSAKTDEEKQAVKTVLNEFFFLADGWMHKRCETEICAYRDKADRAKENGKLGGRPMKTKVVISGLSEETQAKANQEPITINHKPIKNKEQSATRLSADWEVSDDDARFCCEARPDLQVMQTAARFRDYWIAQPGAKGRKLDWSATWRNWVRNEKAPQARASPAYQTPQEKQKSFADRLTGNRHDQQRTIIDITPAIADLLG